ncbi:hypothetical protein [Nonomuraea jabiensis]|uniref:hypothetical protein n=1 Tax=Nonomuraea jabiensis TaxID=882448 RepID=UPI003D742B15
MAEPLDVDWAAVARHNVAAYTEANDDRMASVVRISSTLRLINKLFTDRRIPADVAAVLSASLSADGPGRISAHSRYARETSPQRELAATIAELTADLASVWTGSHTFVHRADVLVELARAASHLLPYFDDPSVWPAGVAEQVRAVLEQSSAVLDNAVTALVHRGQVAPAAEMTGRPERPAAGTTTHEGVEPR